MKNNPHRIYFIFGILVIIFLVVAAILRVLTPPPITIPQNQVFSQNFDGTQTLFGDIRFTGDIPSFPSKMMIGQIRPTQITEEYVVNQLVTKHQLKKLDAPANMWVGETYSLNKDQQTGNYFLVKNEVPDQTATINKTQAITTATNSLQQAFPDISMKPFESQAQYFTANVEPKEVDPNQAQIMLIPFGYTLSDLPVLYQTQNLFPFEIYITADNQLQKLIFNPRFIQITPLQEQTIISIPQAIENMKKGNVSIISSSLDDTNPGDFSQISTANLTSVALEYRFDQKTPLVYPFYHFSGVGKNIENQDLTLEVITPAVTTVPAQQ
jgi:hypothetical protein